MSTTDRTARSPGAESEREPARGVGQAGMVEHVIVARDPARFAAWPANYGMWRWGVGTVEGMGAPDEAGAVGGVGAAADTAAAVDDELVVCFTSGHRGSATGFHAVDGAAGFTTVQARSRDGGRTWTGEPFTGVVPSPYGLSVDEHLPPELKVTALSDRADRADMERFEAAFVPLDGVDGVDPTAPGVALLAGRTDLHAGAISWMYASDDRCRSWRGPYRLPDFGVPGVAARTDIIGPDHRGDGAGGDGLLLMLTAAKADGREGHVFAARAAHGARAAQGVDGGAAPRWTFERLGWLGPEPAGYQIMPSTVRLPGGRLLSAVRVSGRGDLDPTTRHWIDLYDSTDGGRSWRWAGRPVPSTGHGGNPPALNRLPDGRLSLVYGYRAESFGIRARLGSCDGRTWGGELVLRDDGGCHDLGYPRAVVRSDGAVVTAYYFNDAADGERYIAATIWHPPPAQP